MTSAAKRLLAAALLFPACSAPAVPAAAAGRTTGCQGSFAVRADADSFEAAGYDAGPERLARLSALTRDRLAAAARRLCATGVLRPADLARLARIVAQNGEGATEPLLYRDPAMGPGIVIFQFAFQDGGPPDAAAFEQALRCWKRPRSKGCDLGD